ncbi:MAG: cupin protein [Tardiphaga sp.]|nr:cupin protein [Tardiphaga sp.]
MPSVQDITWNILGQIYVPKQLSENSLSWHATFPPETFVPPHIHPTQDEFVYMLEGTLGFWLDGKEGQAKPSPGTLLACRRAFPTASSTSRGGR